MHALIRDWPEASGCLGLLVGAGGLGRLALAFYLVKKAGGSKQAPDWPTLIHELARLFWPWRR